VPSAHPRLERLAFGEECFSERRARGSTTERRTAQRDLGLAAGDGGGSQRCQLLPSGDRGVAHVELGLAPLDGGVAQG